MPYSNSNSLQVDIRILLRNIKDWYEILVSFILSTFYIFQYVKLPYINYFNKSGFICNKISQFSTIILNKNTHKIIILGIYIFGANSKILLKCQKSRFRWGRYSVPISNMQKKWKNSTGKYFIMQNRENPFFLWETRWVQYSILFNFIFEYPPLRLPPPTSCSLAVYSCTPLINPRTVIFKARSERKKMGIKYH